MEVLSAADGLGTTHDQQVYNWAATVSESKRKITEVVGIVCQYVNPRIKCSAESRSAPTHPFEGQRERECGMVNALHISNRKSVNPVRSGTRVLRRAAARTPGTGHAGQLDKNRSKNRRS